MSSRRKQEVSASIATDPAPSHVLLSVAQQGTLPDFCIPFLIREGYAPEH